MAKEKKPSESGSKPLPVQQGARTPARAGDPFDSLRNQVDRLFDEFSSSFGGFPFSRGWLGRHMPESLLPVSDFNLPEVDLVDTEDAYRMTADLPGMSEKDIELTVSEGVLTFKGEKKEERDERDKGYYLSERRYGSFQRSFRLPADVDEAKLEATMKNGVLSVVLPKAAEAKSKAKKLSIKTG
jgi:HSP20 family protein